MPDRGWPPEPEELGRWEAWATTRSLAVAEALRLEPSGARVGGSQGLLRFEGLGPFAGPWDTWAVGPVRRPLLDGSVDDWLAARPDARAAFARGDDWAERGSVPGCDYVVFQLHEHELTFVEVWHFRASKRGARGQITCEGVWRPGWTKMRFSDPDFEGIPRAQRATVLKELMAFRERPSRAGRTPLPPSAHFERDFEKLIRELIVRYIGGEGLTTLRVQDVQDRLSMTKKEYLAYLRRNGHDPDAVREWIKACVIDFRDNAGRAAKGWRLPVRLASVRPNSGH